MSYQPLVVTASGSTFSQLQALGATGLVNKLILAQNSVATATPTVAATISLTGGGQSIANPSSAATVSATGGGQTVANPTVVATASAGAATTGSLPTAATGYFFAYTYVTPTGETTVGTSVSTVTAVSAGGKIPIVTLPALITGATSINLYLSAPNGTNTVLYLYATGITNTAFSCNSSLWAGNVSAANLATQGIVPPVANTTTGAVATAATGNYFGYTWVHAHGETTLGSSVSTLTAIAAGNVPQVTIPALPTGAVSANLYMSDTNGLSTALKLVKTGIKTTTVNVNTSTWNGAVFASATAPPANNTTIGGLLPGAYLVNFTEANGIGETPVSTESSSFTVLAQTAPSSAVTGAGSGSSGSLPAGAYFGSYTYVDANGNETTPGTSEVASALTITAGQSAVWTFNDTFPGWAVSRNFYQTVAGGASGTETLYATGITGTTTTLTASSASWLNGTVAASAARAIPSVNTASVDIPRATFPALQTGNLSRNVYVTVPGGLTGTEFLYATGVTGLTFDLTAPVPSNSLTKVLPPTTNSTTFSTTKLSKLNSAADGNLQDVYGSFRDDLYNFLRGEPSMATQSLTKMRDAHIVFQIYAQAALEAATLIDANPGTLGTKANPIGNIAFKRTWP